MTAVAAVCCATCASQAEAQESVYKFELGPAIGFSGYLGDANTSSLYAHPGFAGGAIFRYLMSPRWDVRGNFTVATLSGNSADMTNVLPDNASYEFSSTVYDLGARIDFNFFNYGIGETYRKLRRWTPYLTLGMGMSLISCEGTRATFNIPMGVGLRYKLKQRLNLGLEWCMTKAFSDKVDGAVLNDLYGIKSSFAKNTDWYSTVMVSLTFEFGERCKSCYYVN
jgi:opacity protein-like surface antigen